MTPRKMTLEECRGYVPEQTIAIYNALVAELELVKRENADFKSVWIGTSVDLIAAEKIERLQHERNKAYGQLASLRPVVEAARANTKPGASVTDELRLRRAVRELDQHGDKA